MTNPVSTKSGEDPLPGCATGHVLLRRLELIAQQFTTRLAPIVPAEGTQVEQD